MPTPEFLTIPPWYYALPLVVGLVGVVVLLLSIDPAVTDRTVLAFAPWMMLGSTLHVLFELDAAPDLVAPLVAAPAVYVSVAVVGGLCWIAATILDAAGLVSSVPKVLGVAGTAGFAALVAVVLAVGYGVGTIDPLIPTVTVVVTGIVAAVAWIALSLWVTEAAAVTGSTGALVVVSQTLDGVSTALGYDLWGATESVPLSRTILELGESLPTAEYVGAGWLFVVAKVGLALLVVWLFAPWVRERPRLARLSLALVAAVGFGPGVHNLLLFTVT